MDYEEFKAFLSQEGERRATHGGLVSIPDLRARVPVEREEFDAYVLRLHADQLVHLLSHVDGANLPEKVRSECILHSTGALLYWVRWL